MKISLALVLVSLSVLTVAKSGFVHERKQYHHPHHQCATRNHTTLPGSTTSNSGTPKPVTTPTSNPNTVPNQVAHPNSASSTSSATRPAATSSGGWEQNPKGNASFTA